MKILTLASPISTRSEVQEVKFVKAQNLDKKASKKFPENM